MRRRGAVRVLLAAACLCSTAHAGVIVGGREWRQLTDTEGFTWNQVSAACPTDGNACTGVITRTDGTSVDVTGWTWASIEDIRALFDEIVEPGAVNIPSIANFFEPPAWTYIDNIIGTGATKFASTYQDGSSSFVTGWTATSFSTAGYAYSPYLRDFSAPTEEDVASLPSLTIKGLASSGTGDLGVWLYRPATVSLEDFTLSAVTVAGCKTVNATVTLTKAAPAGGVVVTLSDTIAAALTPTSVVIAEGQASKKFTFKTQQVLASESGQVSAALGGTTMSRNLTVRPIGVMSVALSPTVAVGGKPVVGTAKLECLTTLAPITVEFTSSAPAIAAPIAPSLPVSVGSQSVKFDVATAPVRTRSYATLSGTANGIKKSKKLTVDPAASVTPTSLKFGYVPVGSTSALMSATLANKGVFDFSLSIGLTGAYASWFAQTNDCPARLAPGSSCTIKVTFKPTAAASKSAKVSIETSATSAPLTVSLSGTGI